MSGKRSFTIQNGLFVETTPICIYRDKRPTECSIYKCKARPEVVHCSGQAVGCERYSSGELKTLFDL